MAGSPPSPSDSGREGAGAHRTELDYSFGPETLATDSRSWWDVERAMLLEQAIGLGGPASRYLDVGCGQGLIPERVAARGGLVVGCDAIAYPEWRRVREHGVQFVVASLDNLPFRDRTFDTTSAFDVIEHLSDEAPALRELVRISRADARLVVTVPAHPRLWSQHDENVGHYRRYVRSGLDSLLSSSGLETRRITYFFAWLAPVVLLLRKLGRSSEDGSGNRAVSWLASVLCRWERRALRRVDLPFGTSLLALAVPRRSARDEGFD